MLITVFFSISPKNEVDIRKECVKIHWKMYFSVIFHSFSNKKIRFFPGRCLKSTHYNKMKEFGSANLAYKNLFVFHLVLQTRYRETKISEL